MKKQFKRLLSLSLVLCLLLSAAPVRASSQESLAEPTLSATPAEPELSATQAAPATPSTPVAEEVTVLWEDETLRGEYEKHFLMSDGSYQAVVYSYPVHELVDGVWVELPAPEQTARGDVSPGNAQTNILDNFVWEGHGVQDSNGVRLYIGNRSGYECQAYIQFATMPTIPAGATITSATMTLNMVSGTSTAYNAKAYQVTGADWTSASLQWSNKPAATVLLAENISHNNKTKYQFSCLAAVQHWYNGDTTGQHENYGIMLCYNDTTIADYNSVYSADCTDAASRPSLTISYTPATSEINVLVNATRQLPLPDSEETLTWTSGNPAIVTVNSSGVITGIMAGETTVTVSAGGTELASYRVYVKIADGVYYIKNVSLGKYLKTTGGVAENTLTTLGEKQTQGLDQLIQLWRIQYMSSGYYNIRPMYRLTMGLQTTSGLANIKTAGVSDNLTGVSANFCWKIEGNSGNYKLLHTGSSALALKATGSTGGYATISTGVYSASNNAYLWNLEGPNTVDNQVLLLDTSTGGAAQGKIFHIGAGAEMSLSDLDLVVSVVCSYSLDQKISWSCDNDSVLIDEETGTVIGRTPGESVTITATKTLQGTACNKSYSVRVAVVPSGTYCIMNQGSEGFLQVDSTSGSGTSVEQMINNANDYRKWTLTLLEDGYYSIKSAKNGLALSIPAGQTANTYVAATLEQYTGSNRQKWALTELTNHHIKIKPKSAEGLSADLVLAVVGAGVNVSAENSVMQLGYLYGDDYVDEWQICSPVNIGVSTDDYTGGCKNGGRSSYYYANQFYNNLLNASGEGMYTLTHRYNKGSVQTASPGDFAEIGAISNDIDFMAYIGHGHAAHDSLGNHLHYDCGDSNTSHSQSTDENSDTYCDHTANVYSSQVRFGSDTSDLRWVWLYTCKFLNAKEDLQIYNASDYPLINNNVYVTNADLRETMNGAHIVMGYATQSFLCTPNTNKFAEYLNDGETIIRAFLRAGHDGEAVGKLYGGTDDHHIQKVLFIPQARYETIYSPHIKYEYEKSDVLILMHDIQETYV